MKDLIAGCIRSIERRKRERNIVPAGATEYELQLEMRNIVNRELDEMIDTGTVKVAGITVNKLKILEI